MYQCNRYISRVKVSKSILSILKNDSVEKLRLRDYRMGNGKDEIVLKSKSDSENRIVLKTESKMMLKQLRTIIAQSVANATPFCPKEEKRKKKNGSLLEARALRAKRRIEDAQQTQRSSGSGGLPFEKSSTREFGEMLSRTSKMASSLRKEGRLPDVVGVGKKKKKKKTKKKKKKKTKKKKAEKNFLHVQRSRCRLLTSKSDTSESIRNVSDPDLLKNLREMGRAVETERNRVVLDFLQVRSARQFHSHDARVTSEKKTSKKIYTLNNSQFVLITRRYSAS